MPYISLILLAGGQGTRFGGSIPKQYQVLNGKPLALHSFDFFLQFPEFSEIVVVCEEAYRSYFSSSSKPLSFANPGKRRQDSVFEGLNKTARGAEIVCIHDAARPFPEKSSVLALLNDCREVGSAAIATPATNTIKECSESRYVVKTLKRETLWEIQTPQAIRKPLLLEAFEKAYEHNWEVTDDVSLIERLGKPVKITPGPKENFKITTSLDLALAEYLCKSTN